MNTEIEDVNPFRYGKSLPHVNQVNPPPYSQSSWNTGYAQMGYGANRVEIVAEKGHLPTRGQLEVPPFGQTIRANQVGLVAGNVLKDL